MIVFDELKVSGGNCLHVKCHVEDKDYFQDVYIDSITVATADTVSQATYNTSQEKYIYKWKPTGNIKMADLEIKKADIDAAFNNTDVDGEGIQKKLSADDQEVYDTLYAIMRGDVPFDDAYAQYDLTEDGVIDTMDVLQFFESHAIYTTATTSYSGDMAATLFFVYVKCKGAPSSATPCGEDNDTTLGVAFDTAVIHDNAMQYTKDINVDCTVPSDFINFILTYNALRFALRTGHYYEVKKYYNLLVGNTSKASKKGCGCHG